MTIAAAIHPDGKRIVYVQSRAKQGKKFVDITIKIRYFDTIHTSTAVRVARGSRGMSEIMQSPSLKWYGPFGRKRPVAI